MGFLLFSQHSNFSFDEWLKDEISGIIEIHCTRWLTYFQKQAAFDKLKCLKVRQHLLDISQEQAETKNPSELEGC